MKPIQIKIGQQNQANKPIFLLSNGSIVCGNFRYKGRYMTKFKKYYNEILEHTASKPKGEALDVSTSKYWDARSIYDYYIVPRWQRVITVEKILKFANETSIKEIIEDIKPEFSRAVSSKWKKIFKRSDPNDINTPKQAWEIF